MNDAVRTKAHKIRHPHTDTDTDIHARELFSVFFLLLFHKIKSMKV